MVAESPGACNDSVNLFDCGIFGGGGPPVALAVGVAPTPDPYVRLIQGSPDEADDREDAGDPEGGMTGPTDPPHAFAGPGAGGSPGGSRYSAQDLKALRMIAGIVSDPSVTTVFPNPPFLRRALQRWVDEMAAGEKAEAPRFDDQVESEASFLGREDAGPDYLVKGVLPAGQICLVGGPEKGQKSNLLVDLALALAYGSRFLGRFEVPRPVKVLLLSGETQGANLRNLLRRVRQSKGLTAVNGNLTLKESLPRLASDGDLGVLRMILKEHAPDVVILDPIYLALGPDDGGRPVDTHRLTVVGDVVARVGRLCLKAGATPVLAHHMAKSAQLRRAVEREPMQLSDLNGAGFGPVAGSWLLVNYLQPYDPNTGRCTLWLNAGGRAGHGGLYTVRIDEGTFAEGQPLNGRHWEVEVRGGQEAIRTAQEVKAAEQETRKAAQGKAQEAADEQLMLEIRGWLVQKPEGAIQTDIADKFDLAPRRVKKLLMTMLERLWAVRARKRPGDNANSHRWRSPGTIPGGGLAGLLKGGQAFEEAVEAVNMGSV